MACRITTILTVFLTLSTRPYLVLGDFNRINVTVDDADNQITYTPSEHWAVGQTCTDCSAHPDVSQMFDQTWHDTSFIPGSSQTQGINASITFNGVAVYVFCAISHSSTTPDGNVDMTFFIDDEEMGSFQESPTGENTFDYQVPVFSQEGLSPSPHTLTVMTGQLGGPQALTLLDYFMYTQEEEFVSSNPPDPPPSSPTDTTTLITTATSTVAETKTVTTEHPTLPNKPPSVIATNTVPPSSSSTSSSTITSVQTAPTKSFDTGTSSSTQSSTQSFPVQGASSTSTVSSGRTTSSSSSVPPAFTPPTVPNNDAQTHGMSEAAKAGVGVGVTIAALLVLIAGFGMYWYRKRRTATSVSPFHLFAGRSRPADRDSHSVTSGWAEGTWGDGTEEERLRPSLVTYGAHGASRGDDSRGRGQIFSVSSSTTSRRQSSGEGSPIGGLIQLPVWAGGVGNLNDHPSIPVGATLPRSVTTMDVDRRGSESLASAKATLGAEAIASNSAAVQRWRRSAQNAPPPLPPKPTTSPATIRQSGPAESGFFSWESRPFDERGSQSTTTHMLPDQPAWPDSVRTSLMILRHPTPPPVPALPSSAFPLTVTIPDHHTMSSADQSSDQTAGVLVPMMKDDEADEEVMFRLRETFSDTHSGWDTPPPSYMESRR